MGILSEKRTQKQTNMRQLDFNGFNVGGLRHIFIIPDACISSFYKDYVTGKYVLELIHSENVADIYFTDDMGEAVEDEELTENGTLFTLTVSGNIPRIDGANVMKMEELRCGYKNILFTDQNGTLRFARNMTSSCSAATGSSLADRNEIALSLTRESGESALFLSEVGLSDFI